LRTSLAVALLIVRLHSFQSHRSAKHPASVACSCRVVIARSREPAPRIATALGLLALILTVAEVRTVGAAIENRDQRWYLPPSA
jgi:hypothetical protein